MYSTTNYRQSKDNIRMMREIGIFSIAVPVIGLFMSFIFRLIIGVDAVENSMDMNGVWWFGKGLGNS